MLFIPPSDNHVSSSGWFVLFSGSCLCGQETAAPPMLLWSVNKDLCLASGTCCGGGVETATEVVCTRGKIIIFNSKSLNGGPTDELSDYQRLAWIWTACDSVEAKIMMAPPAQLLFYSWIKRHHHRENTDMVTHTTNNRNSSNAAAAQQEIFIHTSVSLLLLLWWWCLRTPQSCLFYL